MSKKPTNERLAALEKAISSINKSMKTDLTEKLVSKLSDKPLQVPTISTGSVVLDTILGGGFPKGRIIEVYGPEASGKTSIALTAVGNVQREGGTAVFIDLENALDPVYAQKLGVDVDELFVSQPDHAEQALNLVEQLVLTGEADIIVVDSVAALVPKQELEGSAEDITIGLVARLLSKNLKKLAGLANKTGTTVVFINQTRAAIGQWSPTGNPETTTGGKALKFFASQRVQVKRRKQVKDGSNIIGNEVHLKVVKNKIAPPFGEGMTVLTFDHGINRAAEIAEMGEQIGAIDKSGRTYTVVSTGEVIAKSKAELLEAISSREDVFNTLSEDVSRILIESRSGKGAEKPKTDPSEDQSDEEEVEEAEED